MNCPLQFKTLSLSPGPPADTGHLRPLREVDAGQRAAAQRCSGIPGHRATPGQPLQLLEAAWEDRAILGSRQRPHHQGQAFQSDCF